MLISQLFPFDTVPKGSKIALYGAGKVGMNFISQLNSLSYCEVLYIVDQNWAKINEVHSYPVYSPQKLCNEDYHYIVIAARETFHESIKRDIISYGIPLNKVVFSQNNFSNIDFHSHVKYGPSPWGRLSYSYHSEDFCALLTLKALGVVKPSYVDIGASNPYTASNTALMYMHGSKGINIEANPNMLKAFHKERPNDINLNIGIAPVPGILPFYVINSDSGLSTFSLEQANLVSNADSNCKITRVMDIQVTTLDHIINEYANGTYPDFLTIDTEGLDYEILSGCNFSNQTPYLICAEVGKLDGTLENMTAMLERKGYEFFILLGDSAMYLRRGLKEKLRIR